MAINTGRIDALTFALGSGIVLGVAVFVGMHTANQSVLFGFNHTVDQIAAALTGAGYAANTREVGTGVQICQHHCPVAHVAAEFPELCEAETQRFTELLGTHVQRLATIANGDCACTTNIPLPVPVPLTAPVIGAQPAPRKKEGSR